MPTYLHNRRKLPKHPYHPKNGWNTPKVRKIVEIPLKPKKRPQYPWILRKHQNWRKYNVLFSENNYNTLVPKRRPTYPTNIGKWLRHPYHPKNDWNIPETRKITKIPLKPIKRPQYPWIMRKNQIWKKYNSIFIWKWLKYP